MVRVHCATVRSSSNGVQRILLGRNHEDARRRAPRSCRQTLGFAHRAPRLRKSSIAPTGSDAAASWPASASADSRERPPTSTGGADVNVYLDNASYSLYVGPRQVRPAARGTRRSCARRAYRAAAVGVGRLLSPTSWRGRLRAATTSGATSTSSSNVCKLDHRCRGVEHRRGGPGPTSTPSRRSCAAAISGSSAQASVILGTGCEQDKRRPGIAARTWRTAATAAQGAGADGSARAERTGWNRLAAFAVADARRLSVRAVDVLIDNDGKRVRGSRPRPCGWRERRSATRW